MAFSGQLGTTRSQPGSLVPGLGSLQGVGATWQGPFLDEFSPPNHGVTPQNVIIPLPGASAMFPGVNPAEQTPLIMGVGKGTRLVLPGPVATGAYNSDQLWWVFG